MKISNTIKVKQSDGTFEDVKVSYIEDNYRVVAGEGTDIQTRGGCVQGTFNEVPEGDYLHIVGNGTDEDNRSNAYTLDRDGNAWFAGAVTVGPKKESLNHSIDLLWENENPQGIPGDLLDNETIVNPTVIEYRALSYDNTNIDINNYSVLLVSFAWMGEHSAPTGTVLIDCSNWKEKYQNILSSSLSAYEILNNDRVPSVRCSAYGGQNAFRDIFFVPKLQSDESIFIDMIFDWSYYYPTYNGTAESDKEYCIPLTIHGIRK